MAKRFFQNGDYENTIKRKVLENQTQFPTSAPVLAVASAPSTPVRYYELGDSDTVIWRKLLENQARSIS